MNEVPLDKHQAEVRHGMIYSSLIFLYIGSVDLSNISITEIQVSADNNTSNEAGFVIQLNCISFLINLGFNGS